MAHKRKGTAKRERTHPAWGSSLLQESSNDKHDELHRDRLVSAWCMPARRGARFLCLSIYLGQSLPIGLFCDARQLDGCMLMTAIGCSCFKLIMRLQFVLCKTRLSSPDSSCLLSTGLGNVCRLGLDFGTRGGLLSTIGGHTCRCWNRVRLQFVWHNTSCCGQNYIVLFVLM